MKHGLRPAVAVIVCLFLVATAPGAGEATTLEGGYSWVRDDGTKDGPLKAVFEPTGDGTWDVSFSFDWDDGPHVYTGSCSGSMTGELSGSVTSDGERKMNFRFSGSFDNGTFTGTHAFVNEDGTTRDSGTLELSASSSKKSKKKSKKKKR